MKFSEMPYQRPDIPALREKLETLRARIEGAQSADEAERAYRESDALSQQYATATSLAYIRHSIDTCDAFYDAENAFADENEPVVKEMAQAVNLALLRSPFRKELEARLGEVLFTNLEIEVRSFSPQNLALMQEENRLQSEYQKLYASALADWEGAKLPLPKLGPYKQSGDRATRRRAYEAELAAYPRIEIPMAACLNGIKGEALTLCELRHYDSVLDTALDASRMDRATLDALLSAMRKSLPMFRRYFRLKARLLGYDGGLKFYDLCAPVGEAGQKYTLDEARDMLVEVMGRFSPRMAGLIDRAFRERWIDAYPREGKQGGAFCSGVHPLGISYVMTNFEGSYSSVSTLAHELGHAYHSSCLNDASVLMCDYPMPLAETASIFNETLLMEKTLETAGDETKLTLLEQQIGDAAQVVVDILSRYLFETEVVERRKDHPLSPRELCAIMLEAQKQTYGDGLDPKFLHPYMWACKPHYYSTSIHFYNFPYAFGMLFGLGVYARYLEKGEAFLPEYDRLLAATGSGSVREVAASVGIDVADEALWMQSIRTLEEKVDAFERLASARLG